jgi:hypothetical protein
MKLNLFFSSASVSRRETSQLSEVLAHSTLEKTNVQYQSEKKTVVIRLKRAVWGESKFLWFRQRISKNSETIDCILTVRDVEDYNVSDEHADNPVTNVSLGFDEKKKEVYLGSGCEHGNGYLISIRVSRINITLEDLLITNKNKRGQSPPRGTD